jgi:hypothetical protein
MRFIDLEKRAIVVLGVILALLIPIAVKVAHVPVEVILSLILIYLAYVVGSLIDTEENIVKSLEEIFEKHLLSSEP